MLTSSAMVLDVLHVAASPVAALTMLLTTRTASAMGLMAVLSPAFVRLVTRVARVAFRSLRASRHPCHIVLVSQPGRNPKRGPLRRSLPVADRLTMMPLFQAMLDYDASPEVYEEYDRMSALELFKKYGVSKRRAAPDCQGYHVARSAPASVRAQCITI